MGHDGYGFPKWVTGLDVDIDPLRTTARVANDSGGVDLALRAPTPRLTAHASGERVSSLTSYTTVGGAWHSTLNQTHVLTAGTTRRTRDVALEVGEGRMADDLRALRPGRTLQFDVMTQGQAALHMPVPTSVQAKREGAPPCPPPPPSCGCPWSCAACLAPSGSSRRPGCADRPGARRLSRPSSTMYTTFTSRRECGLCSHKE